MSSLVIKIGSLCIKTLSKPIANKIKQQAREHERFRTFCVTLAQGIHKYDMRFRLGLLQDQSAIERQIAKEAAEAQAKKHKHEIPTVKTEAQAKKDAEAAAKASLVKDPPKKKPIPKIKPLSEAKAIDSGANFVSETFLLLVAVGTILGERWYSSRKESSRREDVAERLEELELYEKSARRGMVDLEREILRLQAKEGRQPTQPGHILPKAVYELEEEEEKAEISSQALPSSPHDSEQARRVEQDSTRAPIDTNSSKVDKSVDLKTDQGAAMNKAVAIKTR